MKLVPVRCLFCESTKIAIKWKASCVLDGDSELEGEAVRYLECRECGEEWKEEIANEH